MCINSFIILLLSQYSFCLHIYLRYKVIVLFIQLNKYKDPPVQGVVVVQVQF